MTVTKCRRYNVLQRRLEVRSTECFHQSLPRKGTDYNVFDFAVHILEARIDLSEELKQMSNSFN